MRSGPTLPSSHCSWSITNIQRPGVEMKDPRDACVSRMIWLVSVVISSAKYREMRVVTFGDDLFIGFDVVFRSEGFTVAVETENGGRQVFS